jgi:hypothetical protein
MQTRVDASACPLCGQANRCAMEVERETGVKQPPCWCTRVDFSAELLARIPEASRRKACVCQACALTGADTRPAE